MKRYLVEEEQESLGTEGESFTEGCNKIRPDLIVGLGG